MEPPEDKEPSIMAIGNGRGARIVIAVLAGMLVVAMCVVFVATFVIA